MIANRDTIAKELYDAYGEGVGGVAFNGDPLPSWEVFIADTAKTKQAQAWLKAADRVIFMASSGHVMRAKVRVNEVTANEAGQERLVMRPVCKNSAYPADGSDEDNTYAKYSPSGEFQLTVANPALVGQIKPSDVFYVDFTRA